MDQVQMEYWEMDNEKVKKSLIFEMKKLRNLQAGGVKACLM